MNKKMRTVISVNSITIGIIVGQLWMDFGFEQIIKYGLPFVVLSITNVLVLLELMKGQQQN